MNVIASALVCGFMGLGSPSHNYVDDEKNCAILKTVNPVPIERCMTSVRSGLDMYLIMQYPSIFMDLTISNYTCEPPGTDS